VRQAISLAILKCPFLLQEEVVMSSMQKKVGRVKPPRVQITYDVETGGAMVKTELPFVVGVLADISGQPSTPLRPLKDRKAANISRDNFDVVMGKATPRVAMKVQNRLTDEDTKLAVELKFNKFDDFEPANIVAQVGPLDELMKMRQKLTQLLSKMEGNDKLDELLADVLNNTEKAKSLAKELGIGGETETSTPEAEKAP
jgi:type VI secretion system protein ImpB